jgi:hypothetical protein
MKSEKRLVDHPFPEAIANAKPGSRRSRRRGWYAVLMGSVLFAVVLCIAASGCCAIGGPKFGSKKSCSGGSCPLKQTKPLFGSWFQKEEPGPPESPQEWLALEPLRP